MKPLSEWTDAELSAEHDAASYFVEASGDRETVHTADRVLREIESEMARRAAQETSVLPPVLTPEGMRGASVCSMCAGTRKVDTPWAKGNACPACTDHR